MNIRHIASFIICITIIYTLSGCAKYPTGAVTTGRQLVITLRVRGEVSTTESVYPGLVHHYFVAIDNDNDSTTGPLGAFYSPYGGTGWVTSQDAENSVGMTSFIEYDADNPDGYLYGVLSGSYFLNRTSPQPLISSELQDGGSAIVFVIDFSQIETTAIPADEITQLDINFITANALPTNAGQVVNGREIDGLGPAGQDYITISTITDQTFSGDDTDSPNLTPTDSGLDIESWQIEVQTVSSG
ncbi:hypothetical protein LLG46_11610 [bacterium]|nr:hypothetical protein [bacterium]